LFFLLYAAIFIGVMKRMVEFNNLDSFDISQILECGQCFRFSEIESDHYKIIAHKKVLIVKQEGSSVKFSCSQEEFDNTWANYFDMQRDYSALKTFLAKDDPVMEEAIAHAPGIRILNQDFWEMVVSFIISQNNRITMIKKVIENICEKYGKPIEGGFTFPSAQEMRLADIASLAELKTGFRAKYIVDAVNKRLYGQLDENELKTLKTDEIRSRLTSVYGIGEKVAHCILLFGLGRMDVFPTDVWIKRIMGELYFGGADVPLKTIQEFAKDKWGDNSGIAQQYLFHYARLGKIGVKK